MKKLLRYLKKYRRQAVLAPLLKAVECLLELLVPLVMADIIDTGIPHGDQPYILKMSLLLIGFALACFTVSWIGQYFAAQAAAYFVRDIKDALFAHIQRLSFRQLDELGASTLITRMTSDMNQIQSGTNLTLRLALRSPLIVFGSMIMAFTIDVQEALIFVVAIPLLAAVIFGVMLSCLPQYQTVQKQLDTVVGRTRENLTGVRVIRAFRLEEREKQEYRRQADRLSRLQEKVGRVSALLNPLTYVIINLAIVALIALGALKIDAGTLTQGQVIALYNYMSSILVELVKLANLIINITRSIACGDRVQAVLDLPEGPQAPEALSDVVPRGAPAVEFRQVTLNYHQGAEPALEDISFTVQPGQTVGIIGSTGSGKSSLVNLIPRCYDATRGTVLVDGVDVQHYPLARLREKIAVVPQKAVLFKGTVRSNLLWGNPNATDPQLWQALSDAQAADFLREKQGLDTPVEQNGANFSGGQRQRLTVARALVRRPAILILDDSASALDFATEARLRTALAHLDYHPTIFIVSQRTGSIAHAGLILVLEEGKIVGTGTHRQLLQDCPVYREIYEAQFGKGGLSYAG